MSKSAAQSSEGLPIVLVPGLCGTPRLFAEQIPALWRFGPIVVADHTRHHTISAIAEHVLYAAPSRFALVGMSGGGYIALEIMRQAPQRVDRLALLNTSARPDTAEHTATRRAQIEQANAGEFDELARQLFPHLVHPAHRDDHRLRDIVGVMAEETGAMAFVRQQLATISRTDSRPHLGAISCPTVVVTGEADGLITPDESAELADGIPGADFRTLSEAGHLTTLEQPERVTAVLREWLSG